MFGMSFGEMAILVLVAVVVVGPRKLPTLMRTAGQWVSKLRRMSTDLRAQSGIDEIIREEGIEKEIQELRALSRVNIVDSIVTSVTPAATAGIARAALPPASTGPAPAAGRMPLREREYPLLGCDSYGALPDDATPYREPLRVKPEPKALAREDDSGSEPAAVEPPPPIVDPVVPEAPPPAERP